MPSKLTVEMVEMVEYVLPIYSVIYYIKKKNYF